jgi:ADP-ribosyl-[dinitrogen reductase] hydrolase
MPHLFRVDQVRGCMLGLAVGDALGAPLEGLSPQQIKTHYGRVTSYVDGVVAWKRKPHRWRMPGLYTDDTQQALALCDVLLECRRIDQDRLADLYLGLMTPKGPFSGAHRGIGRSFRHVLASLEQGVPPNQAGQPTAGIGAAMRIAPVALYFGEETGAMFDSVMAASLMTHRDIRSLSGALAVAHGVRRLASGEPREASLLFRVAADLVKDEARIAAEFAGQVLKFDRHSGGLPRAIAHAEALLDLPREQALASLVTEANRHGADPICRRPTMGFPPACIPTCFYLFLTTDSFEEALTEVVNLGGDTDTSAAILGALAGAHYGVDAIPERWLEGLQNSDGIDAWAIALAHRSRRGIHIPDLISTEQRLTRKEGESFEAFASVLRAADDRDVDHQLL